MATRNNLHLHILLLMLCMLASACTQSESGYRYVATEEAREADGVFLFDAELGDTTLAYTLNLAARVVTSRIPDRLLRLDILVTDPLGAPTVDHVTIPLREGPGIRLKLGSGSVIDIETAWQKDLRVPASRTGRWQIAVTAADTAQLDALYGIGFSYSGTPWEKGN